ncbi:MAG: TIGR04211 family SH3 domain-containing protein [Thiohalomonadaceae bacterium]
MRYALLLLMLCALTPVLAETIYISDVLRVGVRAKPFSSAAPLAVVTSGAELTVLERRDDYLRVRTADGVEGWISDSYASNEVPAKLRLEQLKNDFAAQQAELEQLRRQYDVTLAQIEQISVQHEHVQGENDRLSASLAALQPENKSYAWLYYLAALALLLVFGFYLGVRWHQARVAQRLGGLEL